MITAREAMERAESYAALQGNFEGARFWLDFARELREEAASRRAWKAFEPAPVDVDAPTQFLKPNLDRPGDAVDGTGDRCRCGYFLMMQGGQLVHTRTGQMVCPVGQPGPDDTVVHTFATPE